MTLKKTLSETLMPVLVSKTSNEGIFPIGMMLFFIIFNDIKFIDSSH